MITSRLFPLAAFAAAVLCAGSANAQRADAAAGSRLAGSVCSNCHVVRDGQRAGMDSAPTFAALAQDPAMTNERLRRFLNQPHSQMPPIQISRGEIEDLIAYIRTLRR